MGADGMTRSGLQRELTKNQKVQAAIENEYVTRQRVEILERQCAADERQVEAIREALSGHVHRRFWGRLRWLLLGR
jgi:hypothetical protein